MFFFDIMDAIHKYQVSDLTPNIIKHFSMPRVPSRRNAVRLRNGSIATSSPDATLTRIRPVVPPSIDPTASDQFRKPAASSSLDEQTPTTAGNAVTGSTSAPGAANLSFEDLMGTLYGPMEHGQRYITDLVLPDFVAIIATQQAKIHRMANERLLG